MDRKTLDISSMDLLSLQNILGANDNLNHSKETFTFELVEISKGVMKIFYTHDTFDKKNSPCINHHIEEVKASIVYELLENKLFKQNKYNLENKELKNNDDNSIDYLVDVIDTDTDECIYFQVEETKLEAYIKIYAWAVSEGLK